jgi:preprotein translocase subunit SecE
MNEDPQDRPSFLTMIGVVAVAVAIVILIFFGIGYGFGRLFL